MPIMMQNVVMVFQRSIWKLLKHQYKKLLLELKNQGKEGKNGKMFVSLQEYQ
jgi:hypothetical protein